MAIEEVDLGIIVDVEQRLVKIGQNQQEVRTITNEEIQLVVEERCRNETKLISVAQNREIPIDRD